MTELAREITLKASSLAEDERRGIIRALEDSLPEDAADYSREWIEECERRCDAVDHGEEQLFPVAEARGMIARLLADRP